MISNSKTLFQKTKYNDYDNIDMLLSQFNYDNCPEAELKIEFEERLLRAKQTSVKKPIFIPNGYEKFKKKLVLNDEIVLEKGFSFYHHCEDDIVKFALENRENGNIDLREDELRDKIQRAGLMASRYDYLASLVWWRS
ncbi:MULTISPECIES: hypothetical protein [Streptococcus]|uniref:Uncharacterized protein n=1 Tax=Streptococcus suis R61 TaxID=996306 RepID=A0AA87F627_STRSU|nr:hypothetical protein [Streptococcus suis]ANM47642.1 hypothetical protein [Streptococcus phage phiJH1301-2]QGJ85502.1 hypothetical protein [Streptococcus phage phi-SsuFJNP3_rum]QGJ85652.1 hypothetical protein [Streptococcus phage phi-SsuFJNP9_rum]QGJ86612.1 hypothetical protein [Streptococcus phage phi-SsuYZDH5_rum]ATZ03780.1 hypothetical protein CVO91_07620 [Streptococcus suis]